MSARLIFVMVLSFFVALSGQAQILKKLKKTAEDAAQKALLKKTDEKVTEATENAIDSAIGTNSPEANAAGKTTAYSNPSKAVHTEAKTDFYTHDLVVKTFDKEKNSSVITYFDADEIAMQSVWTDPNTGEAKTMYIDSEGFYISFNESEARYEKTRLLSSGAMGMMAPSMMISAYKLPVGPFWETSKELDEKGLNLNTFMYVEFAFVYGPGHFRSESNGADYIESTVACRGSSNCTKFGINEQGYKGSYVLFDGQDRLAEINVRMSDDPNFGSGEGKLEFFYEDCEVRLPAAIEVKQPGQDLFLRGLNNR